MPKMQQHADDEDNKKNDNYKSSSVPNVENFGDEPPAVRPGSLFSSSMTATTNMIFSVIGLWNFLVFGWFTPVLERMREQLGAGISPNLEDESTPPLRAEDSSPILRQQFKALWRQEKEDAAASGEEGPSLTRCLWKALSPLFIRAGMLKAVHDCLQFVGPQVLNGLIEFLRTPSDNLSQGLILTAIVTIAQLAMSLCLRHYFFMCYRVSLRVRTVVLLAIYEKALTIDSSYYQNHPIGQVTNLMSVDTQRLQDVISYLHAVWYSFLQIALSMYFLWRQLGPSCLAGVMVILLSIPSTAAAAQLMGRLQKKLMTRKDDRVQTNQETITNMKVVKLQAWEDPFRKKIVELRRLEIQQLLFYSLGKALTWLLASGVPLLIALSTFGVYVTIAGQSLDVASALTALALFEILRFPLFMLPNVINQLVEAKVAMKRIEEFLNAPDHLPVKVLEDASKLIQVKDGAFSYRNLRRSKKIKPSLKEELEDTEQELLLMRAILSDAEDQLSRLEGRPNHRRYGTSMSATSSQTGDSDGEAVAAAAKFLSLRQLNFECQEGEFIVVVGRVGSGKSTFLKALLGEVGAVTGEVKVRGKVAYFDQKPFIMNDTVKGNILFGKPNNNEALYKHAIHASSMEHDLALLPHGDECEIGERGITLSGGQKARISMARAVYHDADVSLLDDCLSAVDAHVGRELFDQCIIKTLLGRGADSIRSKKEKKSAVILVTNALQYLSHPMVDRIVVLENGVIVESGSFSLLSDRKDSKFQTLLNAFTDTMSGDYGGSKDEVEADVAIGHDLEQLRHPDSGVHASERGGQSVGQSNGDEAVEKKQQKLMSDEMAEREVGKVGREVYLTWANAAGGIWVIPFVYMIFALGEATSILSNWWLTYWSHTADTSSASQLYFLGIYGIINVSAIFTEFLRQVVVLLFGLQASKTLFTLLLDSTLRAPMSFFDTTPAGRIMNRFSKDVYTLDEQLPDSFQMYISCIFSAVSTLVVVTSITPAFASVLIPIIYYYRTQQAYFSQCYRELKRIDSVTRSPIYALFGETLDGPATVRAYRAQHSLFDRMSKLVDIQQHAFYLTQAGLCWLAVRLELIGTIIITSSCLAAVIEKRNFLEGDPIFAGLAGLAISYALNVTQTLNWAVRVGSEFEANMVSVERIREYCNLESEAAPDTGIDKVLDDDWPSGGGVKFKNAKLRYRPGLPLVLKGLDLTIPARSKVGIVGRTGAGKSTLMAAVMRLVELDGGSIVIDGIDKRKLGLNRLRSSIAVIPQDPVLFSGSVRTNLDPFEQHSDDKLVGVLKRVGLWVTEQFSCIRNLDEDVMQDGENFSVGQRQLLVIARALLDGAGLVICDEATAAIDAEADARIQRVLRTDFANATTLTVAHRLNTIMDSTHIMVMADGKCAEFDTPAKLLARGGLFKDLVDKWEEQH